MIDRYTKCVLTVIAGTLLAIAIQLSIPRASAQLGVACGASISFPCYVRGTYILV